MQLAVTFRNLRPRDEVRQRAEALFSKMGRFLDPATDAQLTLEVMNNEIAAELVVSGRGHTFKAEETEEELRSALDKVFHNMEMQLRRAKERRIDRRRAGRGTDRDEGFGRSDTGEEELA